MQREYKELADRGILLEYPYSIIMRSESVTYLLRALSVRDPCSKIKIHHY